MHITVWLQELKKIRAAPGPAPGVPHFHVRGPDAGRRAPSPEHRPGASRARGQRSLRHRVRPHDNSTLFSSRAPTPKVPLVSADHGLSQGGQGAVRAAHADAPTGCCWL